MDFIPHGQRATVNPPEHRTQLPRPRPVPLRDPRLHRAACVALVLAACALTFYLTVWVAERFAAR